MRNQILVYLRERKVKNEKYLSFILSEDMYDIEFKLCSIDGFDFMVSHFFDSTNQAGYGLISTNRMLKTDSGRQLAIGLIEGDDVICMDLETGIISLWMIQTGGGEYLQVAQNFEEFMKMCVE